jgi:hypothetical protein
MGHLSQAEGSYSTAMGYNSKAIGKYSTSLGRSTIAQSSCETVIGVYNTTINPAPDPDDWVVTDRLFVIGNGYDSAPPPFGFPIKSDAFTVFKNGNVEIGNNHRIQFNINEIPTSPHGVINLYDGQLNSVRTLKIDAQRTGNELSGSAITMFNSSGNQRIKLNSTTLNSADEPQGSAFEMNNQFDINTISMVSSDGTGQGGRIEVTGFTGDPAQTSGYRTNVVIESNDTANEGAKIYLRDWEGNQAIILDADYAGDARITTDELEIRGGSDFAEHFDIIEETFKPIPGMVVSIDPNSTGKLTITKESYDRKVAGIISGANGVETGLFMGQEGSIADGDYPIALTGRVYVYANEEGGNIKPGDLLTTSSQIGEAMKVQDYVKAQGAIIGKAMTTIDEKGFVLVLVNLQ